MSPIRGHLPTAGLTVLKLPDSARRVATPEMRARLMGDIERGEKLQQSPEESARQIATQRAVKVHTLYKANGKIVGIVQRNGWTTFASSSDGGNVQEVHQLAARRGLSGDGLNDLLADYVTASLRDKYSARLDVVPYEDPASALTSGEAQDLMFGRQNAGARLSKLV